MADINVDRAGPVLRIRLNRPERRNALNFDVIDQILDAVEAAASDDDCRVVLLSGEGNGFCAGDDLKGMGNPTGERWRGGKAGEAVLPQQTLIRTLRSLPKPVVVSIHGYALGMMFLAERISGAQLYLPLIVSGALEIHPRVMPLTVSLVGHDPVGRTFAQPGSVLNHEFCVKLG